MFSPMQVKEVKDGGVSFALILSAMACGGRWFTQIFSIDNNFLQRGSWWTNLLILEGKGLGAVSQSVERVKHMNHCLPTNKNQQIQW